MPEEVTAVNGDELGPVDHLVVEFSEGVTNGDGFAMLLELVNGGIIYVLDLEFVQRPVSGPPQVVEFSALRTPAGLDLSPLEGSSSGLLDSDDLREVGMSIAPGSIAMVLVYENLFAEHLTAALGRSGGAVVSRNAVSVDDLTSAFEALDDQMLR